MVHRPDDQYESLDTGKLIRVFVFLGVVALIGAAVMVVMITMDLSSRAEHRKEKSIRQSEKTIDQDVSENPVSTEQ